MVDGNSRQDCDRSFKLFNCLLLQKKSENVNCCDLCISVKLQKSRYKNELVFITFLFDFLTEDWFIILIIQHLYL